MLREIEARGWTQKCLADIIRRPVLTINEIIRASEQITIETAIELSQALGTTPEFWMKLEDKYRSCLGAKEQEITRKSR